MLTPEEQVILELGATAREMMRGDVNSQERGSGARYDNNKPHWGLMPLYQLIPIMNDGLITEGPNPEDPITIDDCIYHISFFQRTGSEVNELLRHSFAYLMDDMNIDFWDACEEVIRVWEHGEKKYAPFNWMKGMSWNSVIGCYMRHIRKIKKGTIIDEESGRHHGAHLVCNAMMLVHFVNFYAEGNDLPLRWFEVHKDESGLRSGRT